MFLSTEGVAQERDGYQPNEIAHEMSLDAADAATELYAREELAERRARTEAAIRRAETEA